MTSERRLLESQYAEALLQVPHTRRGFESQEGESLFQYIARLRAELKESLSLAEKALQSNPLTALVARELGRGLENPVLTISPNGDLWIVGEKEENAEVTLEKEENLGREVIPQELSGKKRSYVSDLPPMKVLEEMGALLGCDFSAFGKAKRPRYELIKRELRIATAAGALVHPLFIQYGLWTPETTPPESPTHEVLPVTSTLDVPPIGAPPTEVPISEVSSIEMPPTEVPIPEVPPTEVTIPTPETPPTKAPEKDTGELLDLAELINDSLEGDPHIPTEDESSLVQMILKRRKRGPSPSASTSRVAQAMLQRAASFDVEAEIAMFQAQHMKAH